MTIFKLNQCPRCKGSIGRGWLYCRNRINVPNNICGWKEGQSTSYHVYGKKAHEIKEVYELLQIT